MDWVELIGYVASALIVFSLTQARILRLRIIGLVGSAVFMLYGFLIGSIPLVITNVTTAGINVWHVWRITTGREDFSILEVAVDSAYLNRFLEFHRDDIAAAQPDFRGVRAGDTVVMLLRDMVPTVVVIGRPRGDEFRVFLDYAIPRYRDFKLGKWFYDRRADYFARLGTDTIVATGRTDIQRRYLKTAGFTLRPDGKWARPVG